MQTALKHWYQQAAEPSLEEPHNQVAQAQQVENERPKGESQGQVASQNEEEEEEDKKDQALEEAGDRLACPEEVMDQALAATQNPLATQEDEEQALVEPHIWRGCPEEDAAEESFKQSDKAPEGNVMPEVSH